MPRATIGRSVSSTKPIAVVLDFDEQAIVELRQPHVAARRAGVLGDVGDALLHDAIGGELDVARQPRRQIDLLQGAADVVTPLRDHAAPSR